MVIVDNIDALLDLSFETDISKINDTFHILLDEIGAYLNLVPLYKNIQISLSKTIHPKVDKENVFSVGVKRYIESDYLSIQIYQKCSKFIPLILLREALNCFIPDSLLENRNVQIIIYQLVVNELSKFSYIEEWKYLIYHQIVDYEIIDAELDKLEKFLKLEGSIEFTIGFLRRYASVINSSGSLFILTLFKEYASETAEFMNDDEMIETVLITTQLFYRLKSYKSLLEYEHYFKDFKNRHIIKTDLSLNKYLDKMRWIKNYTYISPSLQFNWNSIDVIIVIALLSFNPILKKESIEKILQNFPFLFVIMGSWNNFSSEFSGMFYIPKIYLSDFLSLIEKLLSKHYILERKCYLLRNFTNFLNLNYFREFHRSQKRLINMNHSNYKKKYEITFTLDYIPAPSKPKLSILDLFIMTRLNSFSIQGFTFERRIETLNAIKSSINNKILSEKDIVHNINNYFKKIDESDKYKSDLKRFLDKFQRYGFFYVKNLLNDLLICIDKINEILSNNSQIINIYQLHEFIKMEGISEELSHNVLCNDMQIKQMLFNDFIPRYFTSRKNFFEEIEKYQFFNDIFKLCYSLKVFDLNQIVQIIENKDLREEIYLARKEKLKTCYEIFDPEKLTSQDIELILEKFVTHDPPLAKPILINTILTSTFCNFFPLFFIKDTPEARKKIKRIMRFFPRTWIHFVEDLFTHDKIMQVISYLPNFKEKELFLSILRSLFSNNLIDFKRVYWSGIVIFANAFTDFYDYNTHEFFYNKDLFKHYFLYIQKILGEPPEIRQDTPNTFRNKIWKIEKNFKDLSLEVEKHFEEEKIQSSKKELDKLLQFHENLTPIILNKKLVSSTNQTTILKKHIKSIKFVPSFQPFGLSKYFLFIRPFNLGETDLKLLLINNFQKVKYPVRIDTSISLFITYIYPYRNPNKAYINYHTKTKKNVREYCLFFLKNLSQIFNFNYNLGKNKWNYDANRFKIHIQNILFNPTYKPQISKVKQFNLGALRNSEVFGQDSEYFKTLTKIYNWRADNLYSDDNNSSSIDLVNVLLTQKLIFPFISVKNLNLIEKVYIILPNIKKEVNKTILEIFNFFNFGFVYEIEGEYFIYGMDEEIKFENGVMIKLYFPDCEIQEFEAAFELLFQYLGIDHYLILNDMVDGKKLLELIYGDISFLNFYNPLKNLKWSKKDKRWMNHKLYREGLKPIYHPLLPEEEND